MSENYKQILTSEVVFQKIKRMSYEVLENNLEESQITLVGIYDKGYLIAEQMQKELVKICDKDIRLVRLDIDKENPNLSGIKIDTDERSLAQAAIVLVDDVLNSGRTISYSLSYLLECSARKVELAALVNRSHKAFPVTPTYKGYEIATMIDEYIEVRVIDQPGVYLHS
ncbi:MAG: phosphoribosyltransferase family protein [Cyclobacteriaceae bacterium]